MDFLYTRVRRCASTFHFSRRLRFSRSLIPEASSSKHSTHRVGKTTSGGKTISSDVVPGASGDSYGVVPGSQAVGTTSDDRRHFKISGGSAVSRSQAVGTVSDERHRFEISGGDDVSRSRATSTTLGGQCRPEISGDGYTSRCRGVWGELTWLI
ncbi:hypothetical protein GW17_00009682 [Ensete ventricosum]|nr:hypothetical protein GW17_00009682 [Ensete ventricosum]